MGDVTIFLISTPLGSFVAGLYLGELVENQKAKLSIKRGAVIAGFLLMSYGVLMRLVYLIWPLGATITRQFNKPFIAKPALPKLIDKEAYSWIKVHTTIKDNFFPYNEDFIANIGRFTPGPFEYSVYKDEIQKYNQIVSSCDRQAIKGLDIDYFYISSQFPIKEYNNKCGAINLELVYSNNFGDDWRKIYKLNLEKE